VRAAGNHPGGIDQRRRDGGKLYGTGRHQREREYQEEVILGAGESGEASYTVIKEGAGSYVVTVGGLSGRFAVIAVPRKPSGDTGGHGGYAGDIGRTEVSGLPVLPPLDDEGSPDWVMISLIAGGILLAGLVAVMVVRRRMY
jgi:hypothetical protein